MKQTIVIQPIRWRGTCNEKWEEAIQVETLEEAIKITREYMTRQDDWWSILLDDCGIYPENEQEYQELKRKANEANS